VSTISRGSDHADQQSSLESGSKRTTSSASSNPLSQTRDTPEESTTIRDDAAQTQFDQGADLPVTHTRGPETDSSVNNSTLGVDIGVAIVSSDLWSAAYREAVESLGKDINVAILKGENVAELFKQLEKIDKEATQESIFLRGVRYLHSLQVPLERFKLALDLASPLTNIEPTTATVFGVVKGVTAVSSFCQNFAPRNSARVITYEITHTYQQIAISFSTADLEFAKKIGEMLEQLSYIDDCDTLGQKTNKKDIHKVYPIYIYSNPV
jgi:hypothetical protein